MGVHLEKYDELLAGQLMIGRTLSHYRILEKLGAGGMGEVYCAEDTELKRKVAFKVLPPELAENAERLGRFRREAEILATLDHPNIVTIYSVEEADGVHFLTMGLVEGRTLDELIPPGGLPLERFLEIAGPLADAVAAAHEKGITHRDLKPKNIMVNEEGRVKVLDFGVAKLRPQAGGLEETELPTLTMTQEGMVVGTVPYMAPEQLQGQRADARSDVFSLGIVLYQMATGRAPFQGQTSAELFSAILRDVPSPVTEVRRELPRHLGRIVHQCLEKDPRRRFQSAVDLRNQLATLSEEVQTEKLSRFYLPPPREWVPRTRRGRLVAVVAAAAVLVALALGFLYWTRTRAPVPVETPRIATLAVLPLENLSGDPEQDYFADGITEALITDLAMIGGLEKVIARPSVMAYKGTEKPLPQIAEELGVEVLVTGSVLRDGNRVQVTAQLLEAPTEEFLWSDRFQRDMEDILSLQNEIVGEIVTRVEVQLTPREATAIAKRETVNPEAYDWVLRGDFYRSIWETEKSLAAYHEALAYDPMYAPAYLGLAEAYRVMGLYAALPPAEVHRLAWAALEKALEIDPDLAAAHVMRGVLAFQFGWDPQGAEEAFEQARELDPDSLTGHLLYAWVLVVAGRFDEGIAVVEEALARDPLNTDPVQQLNWSYFTARRFEEALETLQRLAVMTGTAEGIGALELAGMGRTAEAVSLAERDLDEDLGQFSLTKKIWIFSKAGDQTKVRELVERLKELGTSEWVDPVFLSIAHAAVGEYDEALAEIERGIEVRSPNIMFLKTMPPPPLADLLEPLRAYPRFRELMDRIRPVPLDDLTRAAPSPTN